MGRGSGVAAAHLGGEPGRAALPHHDGVFRLINPVCVRQGESDVLLALRRCARGLALPLAEDREQIQKPDKRLVPFRWWQVLPRQVIVPA